MDFVSPGLLGSYDSFKVNFATPIHEGMAADAAIEKVRASNRKLARLQLMMKNVIHRKDSSVLEKHLPEKHEFIVTCRLGEAQIQIYQAYIAETNKVLFASLVSNRLCIHPSILKVLACSISIFFLYRLFMTLITCLRNREMSVTPSVRRIGRKVSSLLQHQAS